MRRSDCQERLGIRKQEKGKRRKAKERTGEEK